MPFAVAPVKPTIGIDILEKIDVRVGTIETVEDVQGSDKWCGSALISATTKEKYWRG